MQVCAGVQGGRRREWDLLLELTGALGPNRSSARAVCAANPERPLQAPTLNFSWFTCNASFHFLNTYKIRVAYEFLGRTDSKINLRTPAAEVHCFRRQHISRCQLPMEEGGNRPLGRANKTSGSPLSQISAVSASCREQSHRQWWRLRNTDRMAEWCCGHPLKDIF